MVALDQSCYSIVLLAMAGPVDMRNSMSTLARRAPVPSWAMAIAMSSTVV